AGMRGKCPACACWMYIPKEEMAASLAAARPAAAAAKGQAVSLPDVDLGPPPAEAPSKKARKRQAEEVEEIVAEQEVEEGEAARAKKPFNKFAIVLLVLAILSLGAVSAAPYLPGPEGKPTGDYFQKNMSKKPEGIKPDKAMFVAAAPGPIIL